MKKITLIATALLVTLSAISYAQGTNPSDSGVLKNKRGHDILPKQGDIALGFNALGAFGLFQDMFTPVKEVGTYTSNTNNQITGKYFLTAKSAIRVTLGYNSLTGSITNPVQNALALYNAQLSGTPNDLLAAQTQTVNDKLTYTKANTMLSIGYEKRRGYGRLQGFYGVDIGVGLTEDNSNITYGNQFSSQYESIYTSNFNTLGTTTFNPNVPGSTTTRNLDTTYTAQWTIGIRGFIGVEYFVAPKISVSAEFGWGYSVSTGQGVQVTNETYFNGQTGPADVIQTTNINGEHLYRGFSVDNNNGQPFSIATAVGSTALNGATGAITILFHF